MTEGEIKDEHAIVEQAKRDPQAFGRLYDKYFEGIFGFVFRRTDDESLASDLTSQTFLKALQNLKRYEFRGLPFSAWLYRIAANEVNKHYNRKKRNPIFSLEEERIMELLEENEHRFTQEQIEKLVTILNDLPTQTMEVIEMRFFEGRNFREIAYILNIGESGAKMRLYRALDKIREDFNLNREE
ncbi:MAG: sigma-70 family RNA polymerase sigma factor [Cyclobacteriaceae bacterium]